MKAISLFSNQDFVLSTLKIPTHFMNGWESEGQTENGGGVKGGEEGDTTTTAKRELHEVLNKYDCTLTETHVHKRAIPWQLNIFFSCFCFNKYSDILMPLVV